MTPDRPDGVAPHAEGPGVIMDFPQAWAFTEVSAMEDHDSRCSWPRARLLCDCHVLWDEYARRKAARALLRPADGEGA